MLETIKTFILAALGGFTSAIFKLIITFVVRLVVSLALLIIQVFFKQGIAETNFVDFEGLIDIFGRITSFTALNSTIYTISLFIIAFGIIVSGIKISSGFLDKTGDSPSAFFKRALYTIILLVGYKTICSYVASIMNAIASTGPFNMMDNLTIFESLGDFIDSLFDLSESTFDLASGIVSIVLYGILLSKIIPAIITYYERYLSFSLYLLMGPIVISLGIDPENKDIGKNWLMGILSQMLVILFSMFVFNMFLLQLKGFMFGEVTSIEDFKNFISYQTVTSDNTLSLTGVSNLIVCCALLTIVEKSEQFINMLGLRTIPSGDTARAFSGKIASSFHNGLHMIGGATNKALDLAQGKGRKDNYAGIQRMATNLGLKNANILDKKTNMKNIAEDRVKGLANKKGGKLNKKDLTEIKKSMVANGASWAEANDAVERAANSYGRKAAQNNNIFSKAQQTGHDVDSKLIQEMSGTNGDKIKLKDGASRMAVNAKTGSDILATTADGQDIYGRWVTDDKGNTQLFFEKGYKDKDGNIIGKTLNAEDLKALNGVEVGVMGKADEFDINHPTTPPKFVGDDQFEKLKHEVLKTDAAVNAGYATDTDLNSKKAELSKYIEDHGGLEDDKSCISLGKFDENNVTLSDSNFSVAYCRFDPQVKEIDAEKNNGANIAVSRFERNDETGEMHVNTSTYKGNLNQNLVEDKNGNLTIKETNSLEEISSGAEYDVSNSIFEKGAASNYASSLSGSTIEKLYNSPEEDVVKTDDGMRYKTKEEKQTERDEREKEKQAERDEREIEKQKKIAEEKAKIAQEYKEQAILSETTGAELGLEIIDKFIEEHGDKYSPKQLTNIIYGLQSKTKTETKYLQTLNEGKKLDARKEKENVYNDLYGGNFRKDQQEAKKMFNNIKKRSSKG